MPNPFAALGVAVLAAFGRPLGLGLKRFAVGSYDAATGVWAPGAETDSLVTAAVQPSSPRELRQLPENERTTEAITIYTDAALLTSDVDSGQQADVLTWQGKTWRVRLVEDWTDQAGYSRAIAQRIGA